MCWWMGGRLSLGNQRGLLEEVDRAQGLKDGKNTSQIRKTEGQHSRRHQGCTLCSYRGNQNKRQKREMHKAGEGADVT